MKLKKGAAILLSVTMAVAGLTGCSKEKNKGDGENVSTPKPTSTSVSNETPDSEKNKTIKEFTAFFAVPGNEINDDNEIQQKIADITGVKVKETWLTGQTAQEAIGTLIAGGEYPDFIDGSDGTGQLYEAGALVALDDYLDKYPNLKSFWSEENWDKVRQDDGHIYWVPQFGNYYGKEMTTEHGGEAFWIQTRVLEWDGYPQIKTMDQYFDLIKRYNAANPTMEDGTPNIPYTILCDDWRYFCLENAPEFLDGYPNDGSVIVDPVTKKVIDYNTTPTAKLYFQKLNEEYKNGTIDPESFTQLYDEYIAKLSTGRVLGMIDQWWNFSFLVRDAIRSQGLEAQGCNYVPLPITLDESIKNQWNTGGITLNVANGLGISVDCKDVEGALQYLDDLLSEEVLRLRNWGVEGVDYNVDENGLFYLTDEQRLMIADRAYQASHLCVYSYFPNWDHGMSRDGKNAAGRAEQPSEFMNGLPSDVLKCFNAYGVTTYVDLLGRNDPPGEWFPMYSFSNTMTTSTPGGTARERMDEVKHEYLPKVVMASDFESAWEEYMKAYDKVNPQAFLDEMQAELDRRVGLSE